MCACCNRVLCCDVQRKHGRSVVQPTEGCGWIASGSCAGFVVSVFSFVVLVEAYKRGAKVLPLAFPVFFLCG